MGKFIKKQRNNAAATFRKFQGQDIVDVHKRRAVANYRHFLSKEKRKLGDWSDKLKRLYEEADAVSDDEPLETVRPQKSKQQNVGRKSETSSSTRKDNNDSQHNPDLVSKQKWNKREKLSSFHKEEKVWKKKREEQERHQQEIMLQNQAKQAAVEKRRKEKTHQHKLLSKRNYKGQPNMASRMELLLEKIVKHQQRT